MHPSCICGGNYEKEKKKELIVNVQQETSKKIIKKLDNINAKEKCHDIIDRNARRCECCGAVILDKYLYTYSKQDG